MKINKDELITIGLSIGYASIIVSMVSVIF